MQPCACGWGGVGSSGVRPWGPERLSWAETGWLWPLEKIELFGVGRVLEAIDDSGVLLVIRICVIGNGIGVVVGVGFFFVVVVLHCCNVGIWIKGGFENVHICIVVGCRCIGGVGVSREEVAVCCGVGGIVGQTC